MGWAIEFLGRSYVMNYSSQKYEYNRDSEGYLTYPMKLTKLYHEYHNIGNNIDIDNAGVIPSENYMFIYPHLRNVESVDQYFLADLVQTIGIWMVNHLQEKLREKEPDVSWQDFMNSIPGDFICKISSVTIDPGFTGHHEAEPRTTGVKLHSLSVMYPEMRIGRILDLFEGGFRLKTLLAYPDAYRNELKMNSIDVVNAHLSQAAAQKNSITKLRYKNEILLSKQQKIKTRFFHIDQDNVRFHFDDGVPMIYEYSGDMPRLDYRLSLSNNTRLSAEWSLRYNESGKFTVHVNKELKVFEDETILESSFKFVLKHIFFKHGIEPSFHNIEVEFVYDLGDEYYVNPREEDLYDAERD